MTPGQEPAAEHGRTPRPRDICVSVSLRVRMEGSAARRHVSRQGFERQAHHGGDSMRIGFAGLGKMGMGMAGNRRRGAPHPHAARQPAARSSAARPGRRRPGLVRHRPSGGEERGTVVRPTQHGAFMAVLTTSDRSLYVLDSLSRYVLGQSLVFDIVYPSAKPPLRRSVDLRRATTGAWPLDIELTAIRKIR